MADGRIVRVDTLRHAWFPQLTHVILHAADGATGLGETFWAGVTVEAYIHEVLAPRVLRLPDPQAPRDLQEECLKNLYGSPRPAGPASVETAAASAVDIAAWDLWSRRRGIPLADLAATGDARSDTLTYNTCCDPDHDWVPRGDGPYRDFTASREAPGRLAEELAAAGYTLMKVFPFDAASHIEASFEQVAQAASTNGIRVAVDLYDQFSGEQGRSIARRLDSLGLAWIEDPFIPVHQRDLADFARTLSTPICSGENLAGRAAFQRLAQEGGVSLIHCDVGWTGGVSGALDAAEAAWESDLPITFHGCTGPISWAASVHLACAITNAVHVESVRTLVSGAFREIADGVPEIRSGRVAHQGFGHGCTLTEAYLSGAQVQTSTV